MDELTPKLETDEHIVLKGQSESKSSFMENESLYVLIGLIFFVPLILICFSNANIFAKLIPIILCLGIYILYIMFLYKLYLKSGKYQYYWVTNKNLYYKNIYSICNSRTFDAVFEITDIKKINLSDIYEFESLYRIGDRDFHLKSLIIKYNSIDAETGEQDITQLEIRHLKDYENVLQTISDMRKDG